jgi:hypothetical protein
MMNTRTTVLQRDTNSDVNLKVCVSLSAEAMCLGVAHVNLKEVGGLGVGLVEGLLLCHGSCGR